MTLYEILCKRRDKKWSVGDIIRYTDFTGPEEVLAAAAEDSRLVFDQDNDEVLVESKNRQPGKKPADFKPTTKRGEVVTTGFTQNNHMWAMRGDLHVYDFGVAMHLHMYCYAPKNRGKAATAPSQLAKECKCSVDALKPRLTRLVERGWFIRVDNGKGGRNKNNVATYMASMPAWAVPG